MRNDSNMLFSANSRAVPPITISKDMVFKMNCHALFLFTGPLVIEPSGYQYNGRFVIVKAELPSVQIVVIYGEVFWQ